eukprot:12755540-Prorocentrum_lima.AAC.1
MPGIHWPRVNKLKKISVRVIHFNNPQGLLRSQHILLGKKTVAEGCREVTAQGKLQNFNPGRT